MVWAGGEGYKSVYSFFVKQHMSKGDNTEPLPRRLEAKSKDCREALIFVEKAVKTAGA